MLCGNERSGSISGKFTLLRLQSLRLIISIAFSSAGLSTSESLTHLPYSGFLSFASCEKGSWLV